MPEEVRKEKEVLLEGLERMRKQQQQVERERKFAKMYHKVKFFGMWFCSLFLLSKLCVTTLITFLLLIREAKIDSKDKTNK